MSSIARWSYKNIATVYPYEGQDTFNGGILIGTPYLINCTWIGKNEQARDNNGAEFVTKNVFYTEDSRPKYLDKIAKGDTTAQNWIKARAEDIKAVVDYDMKMFDGDSPDFELMT